MKPCRDCGKEISTTARRCPHCGAYIWHPIEVKATIALIIFNLCLFAWLSYS